MITKTRKLHEDEKKLIVAMIHNSDNKWHHFLENLSNILVSELLDGGMGSLCFEAMNRENRKLGKIIAECEFNDADDVLVSATLNLDEQNRLFELDLWKVDFTPLISLPNPEKIQFKKQLNS